MKTESEKKTLILESQHPDSLYHKQAEVSTIPHCDMEKNAVVLHDVTSMRNGKT